MKKEKLYLIPGLMNNERLWNRLKNHLDKVFEFVYLDIPNVQTFDEINDYLNEKIKDEKINLLGFSLGAYISSYFAIKNESKIKRLFIIASSLSATKEKEIKKRESILQNIKNYKIKNLSSKQISFLFSKENQNNKEFLDLISQMYNSFSKESYISQLGISLKRKDIYNDLLALNLAIFICYSIDDILIDKKAMEVLKNKENIKYIEIQSSSHMLPLEYDEFLSNEIQSFI